MELEVQENWITGLVLLGTVMAILTLFLLLQLAGPEVGLNLAFRNIPVF